MKLLRWCKANAMPVIAVLAAAVTAVFVPPDAAYLGYYDVKTLSCLLCVLAVVGALRRVGLFPLLAQRLVQVFHTTRGAVTALVGITLVGSMLLTNDTALLTFLPLSWFVLERTYLGRYILAIGNNQNTTRYSGIRVDRMKMLLFTFCGVMTAIASVFLISRLSSAEATLGSGYELDIITAALIGGIDINGGSGKLQGTFLGILIIGILRNGLNLMGLSVIYQSIILGALLLAAVAKRKG